MSDAAIQASAPSPLRAISRRLSHAPGAIVALAVLAILIAMALAAHWLATQNPFDLASLNILDSELPPFWLPGADTRFPLGTDAQGRDMWSAMLYGLRISLTIGFAAVAIQAVLGIVIGLIAGYAGGVWDALMMRLADIQLSLSTLMVAIVALALFQAAYGAQSFGENAVLLLVLVIGIAEWPQFARVVRGSVLAEKRKDYVMAAEALGLSSRRVLIRHILPNVVSPVIVVATVQVANAVMAEAALSFLGLGMPVTQPSLGTLIRSGFDLLLSGEWWITIEPALLLVVALLAVNLLGDFLRDALNPKTRMF